MHFHPGILSGCCRRSTCSATILFNFISVPNFGASPPGCPGQSRDHTLLPKRPRMPATEFIDGDWTKGLWAGWGLHRVKEKADLGQLWQPQRQRLEEGAELREVRAGGSARGRWRLSWRALEPPPGLGSAPGDYLFLSHPSCNWSARCFILVKLATNNYVRVEHQLLAVYQSSCFVFNWLSIRLIRIPYFLPTFW